MAQIGHSPEPSPPPGPAPSAPRPRRHRSVTALAALVIGGVSALAITLVVVLTFSPAVKKADQAIDEILAAPPPVRALAADELALGMAAPLSGANRELGRAMRAGVEAALAEVNEQGGVNGRRLRLVAVDDGFDPSRTASAMRQLVERERVFAIVGNVGTPTAAVAAPYCSERKVVFFGALSGGDVLRRSPPDRYVFNVRPSYAEEAAAAVRWLAGSRRIAPARIAVFAQQDALGDAGSRGASAALAALGVDPARLVRVGYRGGTADVADAVAALRARARDLDAVVMVATYQPAAAFVRALRVAGLRLVVTNISAVDAGALGEELAAAGPLYTEGVFATQVVPPAGVHAPGLARFHEAMARHARGEPPGPVALEGWIAAHLLVEGLRRAGRDLDGERLVDALEGVGELDLGLGTTLSFRREDHQASRRVWGILLQPDGTWRPIELDRRKPIDVE